MVPTISKVELLFFIKHVDSSVMKTSDMSRHIC